MARIEFFFDCSSPWTYLAFTRIHDIVKRAGAEIVFKPILVGGVFNAVNQDVYERRANPDKRKASYYEKDLQDWARFAGIEIGRPPVFPVRAVSMMRCALAAQEKAALIPFAQCRLQNLLGRVERCKPERGAGRGLPQGRPRSGRDTRPQRSARRSRTCSRPTPKR